MFLLSDSAVGAPRNNECCCGALLRDFLCILSFHLERFSRKNYLLSKISDLDLEVNIFNRCII